MTVAVAVSGGSDSLLTLLLLRERGEDVVAVHGLFLPESGSEDESEALAGLRGQCAEWDVPLHALDLRAEFDTCVVEAFAADYAAGRTPNPCAQCNPRIKFGLLFDRARGFGADRLATGHYARLEDHPHWGAMLRRGADSAKDQSYFLSLVPRERLKRAVFPLGNHTKQETFAELKRRGVTPPLPSESQEICFVPGDDYKRFLQNRGTQLSGAGETVLTDGRVVGRHEGLWRYTQGQRRGLGIAWSEPLYVLDKNIESNQLIVGPREQLAADSCFVRDVNFLADPASWPETVLLQTRYRQQAKPGRCEVVEGGLLLHFDVPHSRPTPGQIAAVYTEEGVVLAGGVIAD